MFSFFSNNATLRRSSSSEIFEVFAISISVYSITFYSFLYTILLSSLSIVWLEFAKKCLDLGYFYPTASISTDKWVGDASGVSFFTG